MTKEKDIIRESESRLTREKEAILAEQRNQNLLLINLKTIQVSSSENGSTNGQSYQNGLD